MKSLVCNPYFPFYIGTTFVRRFQMAKKILDYARDFEDLGRRLREVVILLEEHHGTVKYIIGLSYGCEGLNYAIQVSFKEKAAKKYCEIKGMEKIPGFKFSQIPGDSLILLSVFPE